MRDWRTEPLERIAEIRSSNVDKKTNPGEEPVRLCNYMDVYSREYITEDIEFMEATATPAEIQRFGVERGDVMITKDSETPDDIGIPAVVVDDVPKLVCGYHVALIKPNRAEVDPIYLAKQLGLSDTARYYGRLANGSTRYGLSYQSIARTPIRLAPLPQQQRIAEILSTVDEAIEQTEALIAKTQQIKAGLMHDLFTRGVTSDGQLRSPREEAPQLYKESPLGWIPKEWRVEQLGELCTRLTDGSHQSVKREVGPAASVPFLFVSCVYGGSVKWANAAWVSEETYSEISRGKEPHVGMVLFTVVGSIGRVAVLSSSDPVAFERNIACISPTERVVPQYLAAYLETPPIQRHASQVAVGNAQKLISLGKLRQFPVVVPGEDEQLLVLDRLRAADAALGAGQEELGKYRTLKAGLMQDLLTGRVRVAVDVSPESAEVAASV